MPSTVLAVAAAAVLGTLAVAPLSPDGRVLDALGIVALCVRSACAHSRPVRASVLLALGLFAGNAWLHARQAPLVHEMRTARYSAVALAAVRESGATSSFAATLDNGLVVLTHVPGSPPPAGSRIVLRGRFEPFDEARNPGEPSEIALERERGLDAQIANGEVLSTLPPSPWQLRAWLPRAHAWSLAQLRDTLGEPAASIVAGELWGERADLAPDLRAEFQETGTVHVLVTAGLHLGVVAALAVALLSGLALPRAWSCCLAIAAVWAFVIWSGAQLPATRAAVMVTAALCARALGRASFSWNSLSLAALVLAALRPQSIATPSFALSFSCVGAIFACAPVLERLIEERIAFPRILREALILSVATQLGTWPLTAAIFLQFSPYAVLANLAVVPCVGASITLGALQLLVAWMPQFAQAVANLQGWVIAWILAVVRTLSALPGAAIPMTPAPAYCITAYDAALLFLAWCARRRHWTPGIAAMLVAIALVLQPPHAIDARLRITVLDVGQADAILIETPAHHALLVDAGGRLERGPQSDGSIAERVGEETVVPFLLRRGIHALDAIVLTHPHGDHAGGVAPVLRKLRVAELADGGQRYGGHAYQDARATARTAGVPIVYPRAGDVWRTDDGVVLRFIGPSLPFIVSKNQINDNSIAFTLRYRSFCMLFTGDAGTAAEQRFLREGVNLRCAILKVGHHGSAYGTTSEFLAAVRPKIAIISVGRHNVFGHPAPSTIATLLRFGAKIYRTDQDGAVTVVTDGKAYTVTPTLTSASWGHTLRETHADSETRASIQ
jgi:competence protein ComEC